MVVILLVATSVYPAVKGRMFGDLAHKAGRSNSVISPIQSFPAYEEHIEQDNIGLAADSADHRIQPGKEARKMDLQRQETGQR